MTGSPLLQSCFSSLKGPFSTVRISWGRKEQTAEMAAPSLEESQMEARYLEGTGGRQLSPCQMKWPMRNSQGAMQPAPGQRERGSRENPPHSGGDLTDTEPIPNIFHPVTLHIRTPSPLGGKDAVKDRGPCSMLRSKNGHVLQDTGGPAKLRPWTQQVSL